MEAGLFGWEKGAKEWRKHLSSADSRYFSLMTQVMDAVDRKGKEEKEKVTDVLDEFDMMFVEKRRSFSPFVKALQAMGLVPIRDRMS